MGYGIGVLIPIGIFVVGIIISVYLSGVGIKRLVEAQKGK